MSAAKLSKSLYKAIQELPKESCEALGNVFPRTFMMISLHHLGLMTPTHASMNHLLDFQHVLKQEQARITNPSKVSPH